MLGLGLGLSRGLGPGGRAAAAQGAGVTRDPDAVELAVGGGGQRVEPDHVGGHHDVGERRGEVVAQPAVVGTAGGRPEQVERVLGHHGDAVRHGLAPERHGLDLAELDAVPAQLDLGVAAPAELQAPVTTTAYDVAGAVEPVTRRAVADEALGRQRRSLVVAPDDPGSADPELTPHAVGDRCAGVVADVQRRAADRRPQRHRAFVDLPRR